MRIIVQSLLLVVIQLLCGGSLLAAEAVPFQTRNQNPLVQIYGLPVAQTGFLAGERNWRVNAFFDVANSFSSHITGNEDIQLDGETTRATLSLRYGLNDRVELGLEVPLIHHGGGFLDASIDAFHRSFGMPRYGRDLVPSNRLIYRYAVNGVNQVNLQQATTGVGDIRLTSAYRLWSDRERRSLAFRAGVKLPTGSAARLMGSGGTDVSLALAYGDRALAGHDRFSLFTSLGAMRVGRGKVLPAMQRPMIAFGSIGLGWQAWDAVQIKAQVDGHSSFYNSNLDELGITSLQALGGVSVRLMPGVFLDFAFSEDIVVISAPDITFHLALRTEL